MSKTYKIQLARSVQRSAHVRDEVSHEISFTEILPEEEMRALQARALEAEGWRLVEEGVWEKSQDGERWRWEIDSGNVRAIREEEREIEAHISATGWSTSKEGAQQSAQRTLARKEALVDQEVEATRSHLEERVKESLAANEEARTKALNQVVERVYAEALKAKAASLGEVISMDERREGDEYELVIKIADSSKL